MSARPDARVREPTGLSGSGARTALIRRLAVVAAVAVAVIAIVLLVRGGEPYEVSAEFENAGQLVRGNQVVLGGAPVGSVTEIELGDRNQAVVSFSVDDEFAPLHEGTIVTVRRPSLSQVAGRQIEITPPPNSGAGPAIPDGGRIDEEQTISVVDVDQFFDLLDEETVEGFKKVIQGFERGYEGVGREANRGYRYLNPLFSTGREVFQELVGSQPAFERLLVDWAQLSGALAARSSDVSQLIGNANRMMNAIGDRRESLTSAIRLLPGFMRSGNTTFVNLRATLDDVDPLIDASKPTARELLRFLPELRRAARDAVPTIRDFSTVIQRPGRNNDLVALQELQPRVTERAIGTGFPDCGPGPENPEDLQIPADDDFTQGAFGESICSLTNGLANLEFFRAYTPELVAWFDTFSHSGYADGLGAVGRVSTTFNTFTPAGALPFLPDLTSIMGPEQQLDALTTGNTRRCPGTNERPPGPAAPDDTSIPFTDRGALTDGSVGQCDPTQRWPGP